LYYSDRLTLRTVTKTLANGAYTTTHSDKEVWADRRSVKRQEFYSALAAGRSADIVFAVNADDYKNQTVVVYGGLVYSVMRSYQTSPDEVELTCTRG
jgi:SPP1 family predicted phage head-tail adaptor